MNKIIYIIPLMILSCILLVKADDICLNPVLANSSCNLVTPTLVCSGNYTYQVFNNNGDQISAGNLSVFNQTASSYYFVFNQDIGTYYVRICDGSTRQVIVNSGDNMIGLTSQTWIFIVLILLFIAFIWLSFKAHPLFMMLDGIIVLYFAYYTWTLLGNIFVLTLMALVGIMFMVLSIAGALSWHK